MARGKDFSWLHKCQGLEVSLPQNELSEERVTHEQGEFYSQKSASAQEFKVKAARYGDAGKRMKFNTLIQKGKVLIMFAAEEGTLHILHNLTLLKNKSVILSYKSNFNSSIST